MKLILENGYPFPYPEGFDPDEAGYECREFHLEIDGVKHFEWKYELTIEFNSYDEFKAAKELTGWPEYADLILSAKYSAADGYETPAIVVGDKAYCGFILVEDE